MQLASSPDGRQFITVGPNTPICVWNLEEPRPAPGAAALLPVKPGDGGWITLFDGKSLDEDDWDYDPKVWSVKNGVLVIDPSAKSTRGYATILHKRTFTDFVLRCQFKLKSGIANILFRARQAARNGKGVGALARGYRFNIIAPDVGTGRRGSIPNKWGLLTGPNARGAGGVAIGGPDADTRKRVDSLDLQAWHDCEITAIGNRFKIIVNGIPVTGDDFVVDEKQTLTTGSIGFVAFADSVEFRNIKIRPLAGGEQVGPAAGLPQPQLVSRFEHNATNTNVNSWDSYFAVLSPDAAHVAYRMGKDEMDGRTLAVASRSQSGLQLWDVERVNNAK